MKRPRHILEAQQFEVGLIEQLFRRAEWMSRQVKAASWEQTTSILPGRMMYSLFYEPSTRTRMSFETAAKRLGMQVLGSEDAGTYSSRSKGESDDDSFQVMSSYRPDVIVVRHDREGIRSLASKISSPVINAGDGAGQHPTQALLDLFTIQTKCGRLENLKIVMIGDMKNGRTVRSLAYLLGKYTNNQITFVAPYELKMSGDILDYLTKHKLRYIETDNLAAAIKDADVIYATRIQAERGMDQPTYDRVAGHFRVTPAELNRAPQQAILMHPLPRVGTGTIQKVKLANGEVVSVKLLNELDPACDSNPRAAYFDQAYNGLPVRMALLEWVLAD